MVGDEEKWDALQGGEPVLLCDIKESVKSETKYALAGIIIEGPVEPVWEVVCDKEAAAGYEKSLKRAEVLERGREAGVEFQVVEHEMKPSQFPVTITYCLKHRMQPYSRVDFKRVSGEMKEVEGSWRFFPVSGGTRTLLVYELHINPGRLIPEFVMRNSLKRGLPEALRGVRNRVTELAAARAAP